MTLCWPRLIAIKPMTSANHKRLKLVRKVCSRDLIKWKSLRRCENLLYELAKCQCDNGGNGGNLNLIIEGRLNL